MRGAVFMPPQQESQACCAGDQAWNKAGERSRSPAPSFVPFEIRSTHVSRALERGIYQAGAQMPNSLPSGSVNCAHLPQGSVLSSLESVTPRALSISQVASMLSVCKT